MVGRLCFKVKRSVYLRIPIKSEPGRDAAALVEFHGQPIPPERSCEALRFSLPGRFLDLDSRFLPCRAAVFGPTVVWYENYSKVAVSALL